MNNVTIRYFISFGFLALLISGGLAWSEYQLDTQKNDSRVVNIAGRQRMLSQRMSKVVAELAAKPDGETSARLAVELEESLNLWERSQNALRFGDASLGITYDPSPTIKRMYENLDPIYERMLNAGRMILTLARSGRADSAEFSRAASKILSDEKEFLARMDEIVFTHDSEAAARVTKSRIIVLSVNVLLLLFLIFSWLSVIHPALRKAQAIDKAKTEFVLLASHQLRTPLSTVSWYTEMLLAGDAGKLNAEQKKYLDEIYAGNRKMAELVNALLNVARMELGTLVTESEPTDVARLVQSVADEQRPQIDEKKIKLSLFFEKNIPLLQADQKLLRIVVQNLLSNAVKYTPRNGKIHLSLSSYDKRSVLLKICDNGCGIPKNQQGKIFTELFRADNVRERGTDGTGLGLYITKSITELSGGKIWFESAENKGSVFYVILPLEGIKQMKLSRRLGVLSQ